MAYNPEKAVEYAHQWAFARNPRYADFEEMGGDCTNFISQCLYAGCGVMNHRPTLGWYYYSLKQRSPSWTGAAFLYQFLVANQGPGPYAREAALGEAMAGDIVQLSFDAVSFSHSLLVVECGPLPAPDNILLAAHSYDADYRPLASYSYAFHRLLRLIGARG